MLQLIKGDYYRLTDAFGSSALYRAISNRRLKKADTPLSILLSEWQPDVISLSSFRIEHVPGMKILGEEPLEKLEQKS